MNSKIKETLGILQEECAEVIVEVSKCDRFGMDSVHYKTGLLHSKMLEMEVSARHLMHASWQADLN